MAAAYHSRIGDSELKKYYFYGDSNTYGYDPRDPFGGCYPREKIWTNLLKNIMGESVTVISDGLNGRKIPKYKRTIELLEMGLKREKNLAAFAVMLGSNDLLLSDSEGGNINADEIVQHMEDFLTEIQNFLQMNQIEMKSGQEEIQKVWSEKKQAQIQQEQIQIEPKQNGSFGTAAETRIIIIAPPPLHFQKELDDKMPEIWSGYKKIAGRHGWDYIDTAGWKLPLAYDGVHLSEEGHRIFAEKLAEWIRQNESDRNK